jgi:hypothetical protein
MKKENLKLVFHEQFSCSAELSDKIGEVIVTLVSNMSAAERSIFIA